MSHVVKLNTSVKAILCIRQTSCSSSSNNTYIHTCIHTTTHAHNTYSSNNTYIHTCIHTYIQPHTHTTHTAATTHTYIHTTTHTHNTYSSNNTYIHTCIHTHSKHTHTTTANTHNYSKQCYYSWHGWLIHSSRLNITVVSCVAWSLSKRKQRKKDLPGCRWCC